MKIARAIRSGLIVSGTGKAAKTAKPKAYAIWDEADEPREDHPMHIPPPKMTLPRTLPLLYAAIPKKSHAKTEHNESYNPPEEYLMSAEELKEWEDLDPEDRPTNFIPKK
jgi:ribosome biogenesis protein ERB1